MHAAVVARLQAKLRVDGSSGEQHGPLPLLVVIFTQLLLDAHLAALLSTAFLHSVIV